MKRLNTHNCSEVLVGRWDTSPACVANCSINFAKNNLSPNRNNRIHFLCTVQLRGKSCFLGLGCWIARQKTDDLKFSQWSFFLFSPIHQKSCVLETRTTIMIQTLMTGYFWPALTLSSVLPVDGSHFFSWETWRNRGEAGRKRWQSLCGKEKIFLWGTLQEKDRILFWLEVFAVSYIWVSVKGLFVARTSCLLVVPLNAFSLSSFQRAHFQTKIGCSLCHSHRMIWTQILWCCLQVVWTATFKARCSIACLMSFARCILCELSLKCRFFQVRFQTCSGDVRKRNSSFVSQTLIMGLLRVIPCRQDVTVSGYGKSMTLMAEKTRSFSQWKTP